MAAMFSAAGRPVTPPPTGQEAFAWLVPQLADSRAAFALIRKRAAEWHVDPQRIGMVGFSAGAMLALATALSASDAKRRSSDHGPMGAMNVSANAPPLFDALAADDPIFGNRLRLVRLEASKRPVSSSRGGHGFGMYPKETTSTGWLNAFVSWMRMHGWVKPGQ
jgi:dienelactone hydrolase